MSSEVTRIEIRVSFVRVTESGELHDCLIFPLDEFFGKNGKRLISDEEVQALIDGRTRHWKQVVDDTRAANIAAPELTVEQKYGNIDDSEISELEALIALKKSASKNK